MIWNAFLSHPPSVKRWRRCRVAKSEKLLQEVERVEFDYARQNTKK